MPCQRIIFHAFQSIQSITVTRRTPELENLLAQLLWRNSLSQLELDDFHVRSSIKNAIWEAGFHEDTKTSETHSGDERKQQRDTDKTEDREDDRSQRDVGPRA